MIIDLWRMVKLQICRLICLAVCSPVCSNGGTCSNPNVCTCASGWSGSICTTRKWSVCVRRLNRWSSVYFWYCRVKYQKQFLVCLAVCSPTCANSGTCTSPNTCACATGWSGATCTTRMQQSLSSRCFSDLFGMLTLFQLSVHLCVRMAALAQVPVFALAHHSGLLLNAQHVRLSSFWWSVQSIVDARFSGVFTNLLERWNMHQSKHMCVCLRMVRCNLHYM